MKKTIITLIIGLLAQITHAQGTVYLSNLDQAPVDDGLNGFAIASNAWEASMFQTGTNAGGYILDSIQLEMNNALGNPSGFSVAIYSGISSSDGIPQTNLCALTGSLSPIIAGIYTYTTDSNLLLLPNTDYYLVLTAGTATADGYYKWIYGTMSSYNPSDNWAGGVNGVPFYSSNGSENSWIPTPTFSGETYYPQYAITAEPVPEPSPSWLLLLGSGVFIYVRRTFKR